MSEGRQKEGDGEGGRCQRRQMRGGEEGGKQRVEKGEREQRGKGAGLLLLK